MFLSSFILQSLISMDAYKLLFYFFFVHLHSSPASGDCSTSYCGQSFTEIRFPFWLINQQPENCGYAGFNLRCAFPSMPLLTLQTSSEFAVRSIDYRSQTIRLYDPLNCLPARLLTFDIANSPFAASYFQNFTLLSCPNERLNGYKPVACLSNSSFSTLACSSETFVTLMTSDQTGCLVTGLIRVPVDQPYNDGSTSQLDEDISLTWSKPDCGRCETTGGSCGYANSNTKRITCFSGLAPPRPSSLFRIIAFAMAIPVMTASLAIVCFMCTKDRRNARLSNRRITTTAVTPEDAIPQPSVIGLDQATIESYTKVVLGESKRLPGHNDATCPICLSEYHVKETVRSIPECRHCFHAECIDEWLKMNGTCPICRNLPSDHPVHVES